MLLLYSIAIGLLLGRLLGGRVRNIEHVHIAWWGLAVAGFAVQLLLFSGPVADRIDEGLGKALYVGSTGVVLIALLRNLRKPGLAILALGAGANLLVILANGGQMPSDPKAWLALDGVAALPVSGFSNVFLMEPETVLPFLGDIFVWPRPLPFATVFSVGDAIIAVGGVIFVIAAMRSESPEPTDGPDGHARPEALPDGVDLTAVGTR